MTQHPFQQFVCVAGVVAAVVFIGAGCAKTVTEQTAPTNSVPVTETTVNSTTTTNIEAPSNSGTPADAGTSVAVPAPGFENVNEMVVDTNSSGDESADEVVVEGEVNVNVVNDTANNEEATTPVVKTFNITARQWEFEPDTVTVNKGDVVTLNIASEDVTHGFYLEEFGVNKTLQPGATTTIEFTVDKSGTFSFVCSVYCGSGHAEMNGTLIVKE